MVGTNILETTSGMVSPATTAGAVAEIGIDAVLFSIDYLYEDSAPAVDGLARAPLSDAERSTIAVGKARRILHLDDAAG